MVTKLEKEGTIRPHSLSPNYDWKDVEPRARDFADTSNLREKLRKKFSGRREVGYVEGPPTLNGEPHIGHIRGRLMKDLWYRYSTLSGKNIVFASGPRHHPVGQLSLAWHVQVVLSGNGRPASPVSRTRRPAA